MNKKILLFVLFASYSLNAAEIKKKEVALVEHVETGKPDAVCYRETIASLGVLTVTCEIDFPDFIYYGTIRYNDGRPVKNLRSKQAEAHHNRLERDYSDRYRNH